MAGREEKIAHLRAVLARPERPGSRVHLGVPRLDAVLSGGLKRGAVHEVFAAPSHEGSATGFVAALAVRLSGPVLWICQDYGELEYGGLAASGLFGWGLDPAHFILLRVPDVTGALRAAGDGLSCAGLAAVVIELTGSAKALDAVAYRRLALGAEEHGVAVLLLRFAAGAGLGLCETRWLVRAAPSADEEEGEVGEPLLAVELQRNRQGPCGCWRLQWSCNDGLFRSTPDGPADFVSVVSASAHRQAETALAAISAA